MTKRNTLQPYFYFISSVNITSKLSSNFIPALFSWLTCSIFYSMQSSSIFSFSWFFSSILSSFISFISGFSCFYILFLFVSLETKFGLCEFFLNWRWNFPIRSFVINFKLDGIIDAWLDLTTSSFTTPKPDTSASSKPYYTTSENCSERLLRIYIRQVGCSCLLRNVSVFSSHFLDSWKCYHDSLALRPNGDQSVCQFTWFFY